MNICNCYIFIYSVTIGLIIFLLVTFGLALALYSLTHPARYTLLIDKPTLIQHPREKTKWIEGLLNFAVYHVHLAVWQ